MKLTQKVIMFMAVLIIIFIAVISYLIPTINNLIDEQVTSRLRNLVETADTSVDYYYKLYQDGRIAEDEAKESAKEALRAIRYQGEEYFFVIDEQPVMILHPITPALEGQDVSNNQDPNGKKLFIEMVDVVRASGDGTVEYMWPKPGETAATPKLTYVKGYENWGWIIGTGIWIDDLEQIKNTVLIGMIAAGSLFVVAAVIISLLLIKSTVIPVKKIADITEAMSRGDFSKTIEAKSNDEIGQMSRSLKNMINGVIGEGQSIKNSISDPFYTTDMDINITYINESMLNLVGYEREEVVGKMDASKLCSSKEVNEVLAKCIKEDYKFENEKTKIYDKEGKEVPVYITANALKDLGGKIIGSMAIIRDITVEAEIQRKVAEVTEQVTSASGEIASSSEEMATGAEEQSRQTGEVATAVEQMSETILETSKNAEEALKIAQQANKDSEEGGVIITQTIEAVKKIAESTKEVVGTLNGLSTQSEQIGQVVEVIDDIADQTNLLAVNAAIEAARAGEHGRGFAVVADEVRKLAERTLKTTKEVTSMVSSIQQGTKDTVESVQNYSQQSDEVVEKANQAQGSFTKIVEGSKKVMDVSQQVATAADEQSSAAEEISKNIESVASVTKQVASGAQQSSSAAQQLNKLAASLSEVVSKLK